MSESGSMEEQVCLVTGASRGFGKGIACRLVEAGAEVFITGRNADALNAAAKQTGAIPIVADATSPEDWRRVVGQIMETRGRLDVLVNNAGAGISIGPLAEQTPEEILESISINLTSAILGCRAVSRIMETRRSGTIINVSSVCARVAWPGWSVYSAAKAGLVQFGKCLYAELRPAGVRVTTLIPSWGATDFAHAADGVEPHDPQTLSQCIQPEELGDVVVSLCQLPAHLSVQDMTIWPTIQDLSSL